MKVVGVILIVLALVIGIVPQFTDCHSQGRMLKLADGRTVDMKCHWTAMAEIGLAVPLAGIGALLVLNRRKESRRDLGILGAIGGLSVIALPTLLIGVCASNAMICNSVMRPTLILGGTLVAAASLVTLVSSMRGTAQPVREQFA